MATPPSTMSENEQLRIKAVAAYVVASAHASRFQMELSKMTKNNFNFDFLTSGHPHHDYYQYCVQIYRQKNDERARAQTNINQRAQEERMMMRQQQQQGNNQSNSSGNQQFSVPAGFGGNVGSNQPFFGDAPKSNNNNSSAQGIFGNNNDDGNNNSTSNNNNNTGGGGAMNFL